MALQKIKIGDREVTVDSSIASRLIAANKDYNLATGGHIIVTDSYRTTERQQQLYDKLSKTGAQVAPPGKSFHEKGMAVDILNWKEAEPLLRKYGFANDLDNDKGHFSVGEFVKKKTGKIDYKNFDKHVEEARKRGFSDSQILEALSAVDADFKSKIEKARNHFGSQGYVPGNAPKVIGNDRDLLNLITEIYTGNKKLSVPSVPDPAQTASQAEMDYIKGDIEQKYAQQPEGDSMIKKIADGAVELTEKTANFFFGNLGKVIGSPIVDIIDVAKGDFNLKDSQVLKIKPSELGWAALESYFGEGVLVETLAKTPGIKYIAKYLGQAKSGVARWLRSKAVDWYVKALNPTTKEMKAKAMRIVNEALDRSVTPWSKVTGTAEGIAGRADKQAFKYGEKLEKAKALIPKETKVKVGPIIDALAKMQGEYIVDGVVVNERAAQAVDKAADIILQFGDEVSFETLDKVKAILDDMTYGAGNVYGKTLRETTDVYFEKELADAVRNELAKANPEVAKLNAEFSFWKGLQQVMDATIERKRPQKGALEQIGAMAGAASAETAIGAGVKALLFRQLTKFFNSTLWKSVSAANLNRISTLIASNRWEEAANILARLYDGLQNNKK